MTKQSRATLADSLCPGLAVARTVSVALIVAIATVMAGCAYERSVPQVIQPTYSHRQANAPAKSQSEWSISDRRNAR